MVRYVSPPFRKLYHDSSVHLWWWVTRSRQSESTAQQLAKPLSRVHQLPHLETIHLTFHPGYFEIRSLNHARCLAFQTSVLNALASSFSVRVQPNLVSLSLHNLRLSDLKALESPAFQTVLMSLQCLQVSVINEYSMPPTQIEQHLWSTLCTKLLVPTQQTLTELTLHSQIDVCASSGLPLASLSFPCLRALSLRHVVFEPSVGIENFILRHAATLARLQLLTCKLAINAVRTFLSPFR